MTIHPIIPDYSGANVRGIMPALLGPLDWERGLPEWFPECVRTARRACMLVLDGLGWDQLEEHLGLVPNLASMQRTRLTTVAPTTTATALTSIATGLTPGEHGLVGYRMAVGNEVMNVLRWTVDGQDRRRALPPEEVQRFSAFLGEDVPFVSPSEFSATGFSTAHLRGGRHIGYRATSSIAPEVAELFAQGNRVVYAYYGGVDKIAHERGFGPYYDAELVSADRLVGDILAAIPADAALVITADHGQVEVGDNLIVPSPSLLKLVAQQSGEGRFRWYHARPGAAEELYAATAEEFSDTGWVYRRDDLIELGCFGSSVAPPVARRLGDVAVLAREPVSYFDPDDTGPFELICRHGSLTSAEVYVPLLAATGGS